MYLITNLLPEFIKLEVPAQINYKTQLNCVLDRVETTDKGRLLQVNYHDPITNDKILSVDVVYNDSTGDTNFPLSRVTTRKWYAIEGDNFGITGFDLTSKLKRYNKKQTTEEGIKRRKNIIDNLFSMATQLGYVTEAQARIKSVNDLVQSYILLNDPALIANVNTVVLAWLDDPYPLDTTKTLRQVMAAGLTT